MIVPAVRQTADWLRDATSGVNALRGSVPRDVGEAAPAAVTVYDEMTDEWVARGAVPRAKTGAGPLLLVRGPDELDVPLFPTQGQNGGPLTTCSVWLLYVRRVDVAGSAAVASDDVVRDAFQTLRIAARAIASQWTEQEAMPARNGVDFDRPTFTILRQSAELSDTETVVGVARIDYPAVDAWAMAASAS